jgi:sulfatase maturation enzyme AslB (radical SAM superfamily)
MLRNPCKPCLVNVICSSSCPKNDAYINNMKMIRLNLKYIISGFYIIVIIITFVMAVLGKSEALKFISS